MGMGAELMKSEDEGQQSIFVKKLIEITVFLYVQPLLQHSLSVVFQLNRHWHILQPMLRQRAVSQ